ncbi:MAG: hypothetical protein ACPF9D_07400 [Owenweeksia sp.]
MKKLLAFTTMGLALACGTENTPLEDPYIADSEIFNTEIGSRKVYGVRLFFYSPDNRAKNLGYQVSFYQGDKVWIDTVMAEITPGDTLEGEVVFTSSRYDKKKDVSFKTQSFEVE